MYCGEIVHNQSVIKKRAALTPLFADPKCDFCGESRHFELEKIVAKGKDAALTNEEHGNGCHFDQVKKPHFVCQ